MSGIEIFWTIASFITLITGGVTIAARVMKGRLADKLSENGTVELVLEDRIRIDVLNRLLEEQEQRDRRRS